MPNHYPSCPRCLDDAFVRVETVISGRRVTQAYYCGHCHQEWNVDASVTNELRVPEKRVQQRAALVAKADRKVS
jgi:transposase-like protein